MTSSGAINVEEHTIVHGVAFRKALLKVLCDDFIHNRPPPSTTRQQGDDDAFSEDELAEDRDNDVATQPNSSSGAPQRKRRRRDFGAVVDAIRREPEMCHPNWAQDEMMRVKPDPLAWVDTMLPPSVWSGPPRQASQAVVIPPPAVAVGGGTTTTAPAMQTLVVPSLCPFNIQFHDVMTVQHRH